MSRYHLLALALFGVSAMVSGKTILDHSKIIEPKPMSLAEFPVSKSYTDGMKVIQADFSDPDVTAFTQVEYAQKSGMSLHVNILMPAQDIGATSAPRYPLIVYVQGSAWMKQDMYSMSQLAKMAKKGYVIAIVEYRHSAVAGFPAQIEDTKTAIRFMKKNGEKYNADTSKIVLWGDSSGGHTALMTAVTVNQNKFDDEGQDKEQISLKAVIDFYGPTDISKMNKEPSTWDHITDKSPEGMFLGGVNVLDNPDKVKPTVPMNYVAKDQKIPPILIAHGNKDRLVPFGQSVMMFDALKKNHKEAVMYQINGADHGGAPFWSKEMLNIVDKFIQKHL